MHPGLLAPVSTGLACESPELHHCQSSLLCCSLDNLIYFDASSDLGLCGTLNTLGNFTFGVNPFSYSLGPCGRDVAG